MKAEGVLCVHGLLCCSGVRRDGMSGFVVDESVLCVKPIDLEGASSLHQAGGKYV